MNIYGVGEMGVGETGVGEMGQIIGETGVSEMGVPFSHMQIVSFLMRRLICYLFIIGINTSAA